MPVNPATPKAFLTIILPAATISTPSRIRPPTIGTEFETANFAILADIPSLFGSLIGVLGGPIGMLLGGAYGAAVGSISDSAKSEAATSLLDAVTEKLTDNSVAIVALVDEENEESLDNVLSKFDAVILRRDIAFVTEEVAEAKRLELEVQNQVREQWKADKKKELTDKAQELQDSIRAKIEQAKTDFEAFKAKFKK